ncbi:hypothetical protein LIER_00508 [Lithospermum erythrorhizon]|uniref:Reverse transcriptase domain-containing protein n=1 Tax=Lithospermum erythrorhizon TaxID=34254 RepID=A0AAV3NIW0_LITER
MPGVDTNIAIHKLYMDPTHRPVKQKKRNLSKKKNQVIREEIEELIRVGAIQELQFPEWIANVVMVKKSNDKWRMCTDFTNLKKACPKDYFSLPCLGRLVDGCAGYEVFDFLDASRGYHSIFLEKADQEKTTFITEYGLYCGTVMPFGLKNAEETYQRMVNCIFSDQIGRNMEIYMDDMLVKSKKHGEHLENLEETLMKLRESQLRINPEKCSFGVTSGKFLGFMISERGIEPNLDKIDAIVQMQAPKSYKEVQRLVGCLVALNRFISQSGDRNLPFFRKLRQASREEFTWDEECSKSFEELKTYLGSQKILTRPEGKEELQLYLAISEGAVSSVLIREEEKIQKPIYYISHVLHGPEENYPLIEKFVLALITSARKLKAYFESHPIAVVTKQPLKRILSNLA